MRGSQRPLTKAAAWPSDLTQSAMRQGGIRGLRWKSTNKKDGGRAEGVQVKSSGEREAGGERERERKMKKKKRERERERERKRERGRKIPNFPIH